MIPMLFHFHLFDKKWSYLHTLSLQSCLARANPDKIIVHYDISGHGEAWDAAQLLSVEWRQVEAPDKLENYIFDVLYTEGGFFSALDVVFLKNFEPLRHNEAVLGIQCAQKKKLSYAVVGSKIGSEYIKTCRRQIEPLWDTEGYPVTVMPRMSFYPLARSNKAFWEGTSLKLKRSFAIRIWESLYPDVSEEALLKSGLGAELRAIIKKPPTTVGTITESSGFLTFD